jgi:hypothetical protein
MIIRLNDSEPPPFAIRCQNDTSCSAQADNRILREVGAVAATVQAKDPKPAENQRDPVQDDARQVSQAYAVHGNSLTQPIQRHFRWLTRRHQARAIICPLGSTHWRLSDTRCVAGWPKEIFPPLAHSREAVLPSSLCNPYRSPRSRQDYPEGSSENRLHRCCR